MGEKKRFELGLELRGLRTKDTGHFAVGVPLRFGVGLARIFELNLGATPGYTRIHFDSPYFDDADAFMMRLELGCAFPLSSRFAIGFSPLATTLIASGSVPLLISYEPKFWVGFGLL